MLSDVTTIKLYSLNIFCRMPVAHRTHPIKEPANLRKRSYHNYFWHTISI